MRFGIQYYMYISIKKESNILTHVAVSHYFTTAHRDWDDFQWTETGKVNYLLECGVCSVECGVQSVECKVGRVKCKVWSVKWGV